MTEPSRAVFLSYASEDSEAAARVADALKAAGIEVWFDKSELRGGDAWDRKIRQQIDDCALFIPVISANAHARDEGYFRLEWKLAVDRSHYMAPDRTFLLPVVIDTTPQTDQRIPAGFRELQWSRLAHDHVPTAFVERVQQLLLPAAADLPTPARTARPLLPSTSPPAKARTLTTSRSKRVPRVAIAGVIAVVLLVGLGYFLANRAIPLKSSAEATRGSAAQSVPAIAFNPPAHSIAVLPFVNMSADREQEYFSDGLTEELLNSLARVNELQVAARSSAFSFKGKDTDIGTVARKLNVSAVLEGSVRRSAHTVRITAQLIDSVTGFHLWSQTYDRDLGDVLKLETDIANSVASALKVTLLGDVSAKIESGGTRNPAAFDAYLRASSAYRRFGPVNLAAGGGNEMGIQTAVGAYTEAIRADTEYALAYAGRSFAFADFARALVAGPRVDTYLKEAQSDARKAIKLAPDLADSHLALANFFAGSLELRDALQEYQRALALAPGDARVLREYSAFGAMIGRTEAGLDAARRLLVLDPLNPVNHFGLGVSLTFARRYDEAVRTFDEAKALGQDDESVNMWLGAAYYMSGDLQSARAACERAGRINGPWCLSMIYYKLGRRSEAEAMLSKLREVAGDRFAEGYADIYAQWGDTARALDWLDTAMRNRDPYLAYTKVNFFFDPLRSEPRFLAIVRALKFPD